MKLTNETLKKAIKSWADAHDFMEQVVLQGICPEELLEDISLEYWEFQRLYVYHYDSSERQDLMLKGGHRIIGALEDLIKERRWDYLEAA